MHAFHRGCVEHVLWGEGATTGPCGCMLRPPLATPGPACALDPTRSVLGLEIGDVIRDNATGQLMDGAVDAVSQLVAFLGPNRVFLISKARLLMQEKSRAFLVRYNLFQDTGLHEVNLLYCLERADKAPLCQWLGITHFVDDHVDVLKYLETVDHRLLFRPDDKETIERRVRVPRPLRQLAGPSSSNCSSLAELVELLACPAQG